MILTNIKPYYHFVAPKLNYFEAKCFLFQYLDPRKMLRLHSLKLPHWWGHIMAVVNSDPVNAYVTEIEVSNVINSASTRTGIRSALIRDLIPPSSRLAIS